MAKDKERATAKALFMKGKAQKDIAQIVNVQEKTINTWCRQFGWKQQLDAKLNGNNSRIENLKILIGSITEDRLQLRDDIKLAEQAGDNDSLQALTKKVNQHANEVAMYSKALEQLDQDKKIPLTVYIDVMDKIFADMQKTNPKLFMDLIEFQEEHINKVSLKY